MHARKHVGVRNVPHEKLLSKLSYISKNWVQYSINFIRYLHDKDKIWHEGNIFKLKQNSISGEFLNLLCDFLRNRKQTVVLNEQVSTWTNVNAGVPQGLILGSFLFLIYINDLADELSSNTKLFADETSLFSVAHNRDSSAAELNNGLAKISHWAQQWKMIFNTDPRKQAHEVISSRKVNKESHPHLTFNNSIVYQVRHKSI